MKIFSVLAPVFGIMLIGFAALLYCVKNFTYKIEGEKVIHQKVNSQTWKVEKREIAGAHAPSFKIMMSTYAKDKNHAYLDGRLIKGCDPKTFKVLDYTWKFSRDADHVYFRHSKISDDPENFEILEKGESKDRFHRYRYQQVVETFKKNGV